MTRNSTLAVVAVFATLVTLGCGGGGLLGSGTAKPVLTLFRYPTSAYGIVAGLSENANVLAVNRSVPEAFMIVGESVTVIAPPPPWTSAGAGAISSDGQHWAGGLSRWTGTDYQSMVAHYTPSTGLTTPEAPGVYASVMRFLEDDGTIYGTYRRVPGDTWNYFRWKSPGPLEPIETLPRPPVFDSPQLTPDQAQIVAPNRSRNHKWSGGHVVWKDEKRPVSPVIVDALGRQKLLDGVGTVWFVDDAGRVALFRETRGLDDWGPWSIWIEGSEPRAFSELLVELGFPEAAEQEPQPQRLTGNGGHLIIQHRDQRILRLDIAWP